MRKRYPAARRATAAAIKSAREAKGLSQRDLSVMLGESHSLISRIESMDRGVEVHELTAIAKALGMDPVALFKKTLR
jgi:transcriptional regulator with XRE-family HTH domain